MKKILVIGSSGAGKSTFARKLGEKTGLQVIHLDRLYWQPNWTEPSKEEWKQTVEETLKGDSWIVDGNFGGTMEMRIKASDTIVFFDLPRALCVYRILKRIITYRKGKRPDMAEDCDEKFDWKFLKWVWRFPKETKPKIEERLKRFENEKTIIRLKSRKEVEEFLTKYAHSTVSI